MRKSHRSIERAGGLCAMAFAVVLSTHAVASAAVTHADTGNIAVAQDFLRTLHPELAGLGLRMIVTTNGSLNRPWNGKLEFFSVMLGDSSPGHFDGVVLGKDFSVEQLRAQEAGARQVLAALFWIDQRGHIYHYFNNSGIVNRESNTALRRTVDSHPEWNYDQIVASLKAAGALYSPKDKDRFVKSLPLTALERFLGRIKIDSVEFHTRGEEMGRKAADLYWQVDVIAVPRSGSKTTHYELKFEPFGGKLLELLADSQ